MKSQSLFKISDKEFVETDKFITLSTCTGDDATRFVVHGVRLDPPAASDQLPDVNNKLYKEEK